MPRFISIDVCFSANPVTGEIRDHGPAFVAKFGFDPERCRLTVHGDGLLTITQPGRGPVCFAEGFWVNASLVPGASPVETPSS